MSIDKHIFAIFADISKLSIDSNTIHVDDEYLLHRLGRVLRLQINDEVILFDRSVNLICQIIDINKKNISLKLKKKNNNKLLSPKITAAVCLLKRESFEEAIYNCVELGANIIQPIITQKVHQKKLTAKDVDRLEKVIISAAEQSKNFNFPIIEPVLELEQYLQQIKNPKQIKVCFDAMGNNLSDVYKDISLNQKIDEFVLLIGPEGGFVQEEINLLKQHQFIFCRLTPTILRAQTANCIGLGAFRSLFY